MVLKPKTPRSRVEHSTNLASQVPLEVLTKTNKGFLAGSVGRARDSQTQDREFKLHIGHGAYFKKKLTHLGLLIMP